MAKKGGWTALYCRRCCCCCCNIQSSTRHTLCHVFTS